MVQQALQPGFHFPLHAHDSALQLGALVGLGGWVALAWLCWEAWQRTDRAGRTLLAALAVGALTQDVLGDLEVARAAAAWVAWGVVARGSAVQGAAAQGTAAQGTAAQGTAAQGTAAQGTAAQGTAARRESEPLARRAVSGEVPLLTERRC